MVPKILITLTLTVLLAAQVRAQSFASSLLLEGVGGVGDLAAEDFDGDGDVDIMLASWSPGEVSYYDRVDADSLRGYLLYVSGGAGRQITAGDFDGDGDLDAAFALWTEERYVILRNTSSPQPQNRFAYELFMEDAGGPFAVFAADVTGDGATDLITSELRSSTNQVRVFEQLNGELADIWLNSLPYDPLGLDVADIDGDGAPEILIAAGGEGGFYVMRRTQSGGFALNQAVPDYYLTAVRAADLDADGNMDVVACDFGADRIRRFEYDGSAWTSTLLPTGISNPRDIVIADFDSDDLLDIAATSQGVPNGDGGVFWWRQTTNGAFVSQQLTDAPDYYGLSAVDYDRDGDVDLLACNLADEEVVFFRNLMGSPTRIVGTVTSARTGEPLSNVRVVVQETGSYALTTAAGHYELGSVAGTFTLEFQHPCWISAVVENVTTETDDTTYVDLALTRPVMELPVTSLNIFLQNEVATDYSYDIHNSGDGVLHVVPVVEGLAPGTAWLSITPAVLDIAPGTTDHLTITFSPDTSNDAAYDYLGELFLTSNSCPDTAVRIAVVAIVLDAPETGDVLPRSTALLPAYPNPFNAQVTLPVSVTSREDFSLAIFDILGRRVAGLHRGSLEPGYFAFQWRADNAASGRYLAVLESASGRWEWPLTLIK
ncbi:MAG: VCBS repeat-containing protein [bacterium]|nr:VCBS repeat-containing protein [bacterium]